MLQLQHHQGYVEELRQRFGSVRVVRQTPQQTLLQVDHKEPKSGYPLTLYVALSENFPRAPPTVAYFGGRNISITPLTTNGGDADRSAWNPQTPRLADAVANAFENVAALWGSAAPPSLDQITEQLATLSDLMLQDIVTNPNCLESYAYQLPFLKSIREAGRQTMNDIERVATENLTLQVDVEGLHKEVSDLQSRLKKQVDAMQRTRGTMTLLDAVGTPEALAKTFANDVKNLDSQCEVIAKKLLAVDYASEKRLFDDLMNEYMDKAKERHIMDLKRRAYHASMN